MFKKGDLLVYKKDVCVVEEVKVKYIKDTDYYVLTPLTDKSLKIQIPVTSSAVRSLITKERVKELIKSIPSVEIIKTDSKTLENDYKELMQRGTHEDLIKIIKTSYLRNQERIDNNKKTTDKDNYYFNQAETHLYNEFSVVLNLSYEDTKEYIINEVNKIII
ncbi:MAG: hypothetical protein IJE89_01750 [Bacilli bacterium]|nr:hypothetical protein [Bacilli bacterium]